VSKILVTPEELESWSGQLARGSSEIEAQLSALRSTIAPAAEEWIGQGSQQFQALWEEWAQSAASLQQALDGISQMLAQAAQTYAQSDTDVAGLMR
jgi:WXG100 family type VII secretion target